jgi:hypothetical protein
MFKEEIINDLRSSILPPMKTDYMSVWDLLELVCKQVELEMVVQDDGVLIRRQPPKVCQECFGKTVLFKGSGLDSQYYICSRVDTPGHLSMMAVNQIVAEWRITHSNKMRFG